MSTTSDQVVWKFLQGVFGGCRHEDWFTGLVSLPWRRAWTLNIDDAFENAYRDGLRAPTQPLRVVNWTDEYADRGSFELIHLHGSISGAIPSPIVFSFSDYQIASRINPVWHQVFRGTVASDPVVVVGAKILDDPDVETTFLADRVPRDAPSIFVDPYISDDYAWELQHKGYVVLRTTAETFTSVWRELHSFSDGELRSLYEQSAIALPQMRVLDESADQERPASHDLLGGSEPQWVDARRDLIAEFKWIASARDKVLGWTLREGGQSGVLLLIADRLAGATAGAFKIAYDLHRANLHVLWFDKSTRFDVDDLIEYCSGRGGVVVIVDGAHRFANDVDRALTLLTGRSDVSIVFVLFERKNHQTLTEDALAGRYPKESVRIDLRRTTSDGRRIAQVLEREGRLGSLEGQPEQEQARHFADRDIFAAMGELSNAPGFTRRFSAEVESLKELWQRDLLLLVSLASSAGAQVSLTEAAFAVQRPASLIADSVARDDHLNALIEVLDDLIFPRHRQRGADLVGVTDRSAQLDRLANMLISLSPLYTRSSHKNRNRVSILVASLMGARMLRSAFQLKSLSAFYEKLLPQFGHWNARYWEQRAIDRRIGGELAQAEAFALRAAVIQDDAFTQTTLGAIQIDRAIEFARVGDARWERYYEDGYASLERAAGSGPGRVARMAFLRGSLKLLPLLREYRSSEGDVGEDVGRVERDWTAVYSIVRVRFADEFGEDQELRDLARRFDHDAQSSGQSPLGHQGPQHSDRARNTRPRDPRSLPPESAELQVLRKVLLEQKEPVPISSVAREVERQLGVRRDVPWYRPFNSLAAAVRSVRGAGALRYEGGRALFHPGSRPVRHDADY
ncbi:SIR2 family protein [Microbacterium sp. NPDC089987]|uniref:P-loop NTPase n=1 Tax=Microbacterium sp. NPDC089987 TaxID=3364202 RepID=UPI0037FE866E